MSRTDIYFLIIILLFIVMLLVLIKTFFSYLKKKKESAQERYDSDSSLFFKEGELLSALTTAPKDSEGNVDVTSVVDKLIELKNNERAKTDKETSAQVSSVKYKSASHQSNFTNRNKQHEDVRSHNNSEDNYQQKDSNHSEEERMVLLEEIINELKLNDSELLEKKNNGYEKSTAENSFQSKKESYNLLIEKDKIKSEATEKEHIHTIEDVLNEFITLKGVNAVCLIERDGTIINCLSTTFMNYEFISTHASSLVNTSELLGKEQEKGLLTMSTIEFKKGFIIGSPISEKRTLIIDASEEATLGMLRYLIIKHRKALAAEVTS